MSEPISKINPPRRHRWVDTGSVHSDKTPSGCEEHERRCNLCGLTKITVHTPIGYPFRAWRSKSGVRFADTAGTPACESESE